MGNRKGRRRQNVLDIEACRSLECRRHIPATDQVLDCAVMVDQYVIGIMASEREATSVDVALEKCWHVGSGTHGEEHRNAFGVLDHMPRECVIGIENGVASLLHGPDYDRLDLRQVLECFRSRRDPGDRPRY